MLTSAAEWGRMSGGLPLIRWLKSPPSRFSFLSPLEAERVVGAAASPPWRLMLLTALHSGLRLGELVALRWGDVDMERRQLCVQRSSTKGIETSPKNNRIRFVPLTAALTAALRAEVGEPSRYVFEKRGRPVTHAMAWRALQTACARADVSPIGWHARSSPFKPSSGTPISR